MHFWNKKPCTFILTTFLWVFEQRPNFASFFREMGILLRCYSLCNQSEYIGMYSVQALMYLCSILVKSVYLSSCVFNFVFMYSTKWFLPSLILFLNKSLFLTLWVFMFHSQVLYFKCLQSETLHFFWINQRKWDMLSNAALERGR